jgi:hypothetical protein
MSVTFGHITDLHMNSYPPYAFFLWGQPGGAPNSGEWRVCNTADVRQSAALDDFHDNGIDLVVDTGDHVDFKTPDDETTHNGQLERVTDIYDASDFVTINGGEVAALAGNHEDTNWQGTTGDSTRAAWISRWDASCHVTRANGYSIADAGGNVLLTEPMCYTYDYQGIRFVMLGYVYQDYSTFADYHAAYLNTHAASTTAPVIVCMHLLSGAGSAFQTQAFQNVLIANKNIIAVIAGHDHRGMYPAMIKNAQWQPDGSGTPVYTPDTITYADDIWVYLGAGGVRPIENASRFDPCPAGTTWGVNDSCHSIISVEPQWVRGVSRMRANLQVTGFYQSSKHTKAFDKCL